MTARGGNAVQLTRLRRTPSSTAPRLNLSSRQHRVVTEVANSLISDQVRHSFLLRVDSICSRNGTHHVSDALVQAAISSALMEVLDGVPESAVRQYKYYQVDAKLPGAWKSVWQSWWSVTEPNGTQRTLGPYTSFDAAWAAKLADEGGSP